MIIRGKSVSSCFFFFFFFFFLGRFSFFFCFEKKSVAAMRLPRMPEKELDPIVENYHKRFFSKTLALPNFGGHRMLPRSSEISAGSLIESRSPFELGVVSDKFLEKIRDAKISDPALIKRMLLNYLRLLAPPGESVGVLAGQLSDPYCRLSFFLFSKHVYKVDR